MYLTQPQYEAIYLACDGKQETIAPELLQWLLDNGLIEPEMFGYRVTEFGEQSARETYYEHEQLKRDHSNTIGIHKRNAYHTDDDLSIIKRKPLDPAPTKAKPQTKFK